MNLKVISRNVGVALLVSSLFMLLAVMVSLIDGGDSALAPLLISFTITFIVGVFPFIFTRKNANISLKDGFMIIFLSWLLSFIFGALPYALWGGPFTVINAWFESVSGFTTTGATILEDVEALPRSLLFWRASTHFIGGLGVVIFLLLIIPNTSPIRLRLTNMELSSLSRDDYRTRANKSVYIFASVFLGLAGTAFVTYMLVGMDWFDAICHAMSACSSCGFSTKNASIAAFNSPAVECVIMVFMVCAGIHFGVFLSALTGRGSVRGLSSSLKTYLLFMLVVGLAISVNLWYEGIYHSFVGSLRRGFFHVISLTTTTGFAITDTNIWPAFCVVLLTICSLICACSGSTTGGIKIDRMVIMAKSVQVRILQQRNPNRFYSVRIDGRSVSQDKVEDALNFIAVYMLLVAVGCLCFTGFGNDLQTSFSAAVACLGNVGPGFSKVGSMNNYATLNAATKAVGIMLMFLGRLEIFEILQLFYSHRSE